jgi:formate hydrogenlyase transcriptional activator
MKTGAESGREPAGQSPEEPCRFESLVAEMSTSFLNLPAGDLDAGIRTWLGRLGEFLNVDRASLWSPLKGGGRIRVTHSWAAPGLPDATGMESSEAPWAGERVGCGLGFSVSRLADLPEEASSDKEAFRALGAKSLVAVPMEVGGFLYGGLTIAMLREEREWPPDVPSHLRLAAEIFAAALLRKRALDELEREKQKAQTYLDIAGVILVVIESDETVSLINRKGCELLGRSEKEIIGKNWFDIVIPERERKRVQNTFRKLIAGEMEPVEYFENPVTTKSGEERIIAWHNSVIRDDAGLIVRTLSSGEDITERKRARIDLENALLEISNLKDRVEAENIYLREEIRMARLHGGIVSESEAMKSVMIQAEQVADTGSTVLILGETGTGKERLARAIHDMSSRKDHPLVTVNCAAMPSTLVESELFGREKGAYTGAAARQIGRFEVANHGTIFLDEIGELSRETQAKLLRVLQDGNLERLGSTETIKVDVRVIAATNRDLEEAVRDGSFREDLFYRLNVYPITIPALRERREDIPPLVRAFVREFNETMGKRVEHVTRKSLKDFARYPWPGNIRELRNVIERAMIRAGGKMLHVELPSRSARPDADDRTLAGMERRLILHTLDEAGWRVRGPGGAAEALGLKATTLESKMKKLGIKRPSRVERGSGSE